MADSSAAAHAAGLLETVRALDRGEVSATELTRQALARIDAAQPVLNAFRIVRREAALAEAAER
ncbi:amidase, partial [Streptomyces sp. 12297]